MSTLKAIESEARSLTALCNTHPSLMILDHQEPLGREQLETQRLSLVSNYKSIKDTES